MHLQSLWYCQTPQHVLCMGRWRRHLVCYFSYLPSHLPFPYLHTPPRLDTLSLCTGPQPQTGLGSAAPRYQELQGFGQDGGRRGSLCVCVCVCTCTCEYEVTVGKQMKWNDHIQCSTTVLHATMVYAYKLTSLF